MDERRQTIIKIDDAKFKNYINEIEKDLLTDKATEHTYRPTIKTLIESFIEGLNAINDPQRTECGAPDFIITVSSRIIGYIETKNINENLFKIEKTNQIKRYLSSLPNSNFILTDYLEFRWYTDGELRATDRLGNIDHSGKIKIDSNGLKNVQQLLSDFLLHRIPSVATAKELALRMARIAQMICSLIIKAFETEPEKGSLHLQLQAFRETLIPDISSEQFADMYAQTIVYGLFAARTMSTNGKSFSRREAAYLIPKTNPFLRNLFNEIAGPNLDERIAWIVDDLAQLLADADMSEILRDFGHRTKKEDPVVHFYETFLTKYNPAIREMRGVYYTPEQVVSYITNSLDLILKSNKFNCTQGLIDSKILILDPAVGTGTFLFSVIKLIYENLKDQRGSWDDYVEKHLLKRVFGFELLMAPYAVCHLKLGLLLQELGYQFKTGQRLGVYLTNTLEEAITKSQILFGQFIVEESSAASEIKQHRQIMVILGNPPYSGHSANASEKYITEVINGKLEKGKIKTWIGKLIEDYKFIDGKPLKERNPKWLQDDYVKFIRFSQWRIEKTGQGILGFITNHSYLDNPTFRGMRQSLMNTFTDIYILNLHGNAKKKETCPDGSKDENIFPVIEQGVAIGIFIKEPDKKGLAKVHCNDIWGLRENKYEFLSENDIKKTEWKEIVPNSPFYFFIPIKEEYKEEYEKYIKITDIFPIHSVGIVTARDTFVIDFDKEALKGRIKRFRDERIPDEIIRQDFNLNDKPNWKLKVARERLIEDENWENSIIEILYRPFDNRWVFYHDELIERSRKEVMQHMIKENLGLISIRRSRSLESWKYALITDRIIAGATAITSLDINYLFPLYLHKGKNNPKRKSFSYTMMLFEPPTEYGTKKPNLSKTIIERLTKYFKTTPSPEQIFFYIYAVLNSNIYRLRYADFLKFDFPRIPLISNKKLFQTLSEKGEELVSMHLLKSPVVEKFITKFPIAGSSIIDKVKYDENTKRLSINETQYFESIPKGVYEFHIGGYKVLEKWLKERKGKVLSFDEAQHFQKIVVALNETISIMKDIDEIIGDFPIK